MATRIVISGRVQGVFFREFIRIKANQLGVKGYVQNLDSGDVEVVAEGPEDKINELIKYCRKGPMFSKVTGIKVEKEKDQGFTSFEAE